MLRLISNASLQYDTLCNSEVSQYIVLNDLEGSSVIFLEWGASGLHGVVVAVS